MVTKNNPFQSIANSLITSSSNKSTAIGDELYKEFCYSIKATDRSLTEYHNNLVTVFYKGKKSICSVETQNNSIKVTINAKIGTLIDKKKLLRDVSKIGHWGVGDYQVKLTDKNKFDGIIEIIKQLL